MAAAIAGDSVIAGKGTLADEIEHAQFISHGPGLSLVYPHQRCVNDELLVHAQIQRHVQALYKGIAAVGVATEIGL